MKYGYARVSTRGQVNGNSLEDQRSQLMDNGCDEIIEEQYTGLEPLREDQSWMS